MGPSDRTAHGGIASLAALIEAHGEAVEADLLERRRGLRDLYLGFLTYRELAVIVRYLPPESATKTALREEAEDAGELDDEPEAEPGRGPWSKQEVLLRDILQAVVDLTWLFHRSKGGKSPAPRRIPGPGRGLSRKEKRRLLDAIEKLERIRANRGGES